MGRALNQPEPNGGEYAFVLRATEAEALQITEMIAHFYPEMAFIAALQKYGHACAMCEGQQRHRWSADGHEWSWCDHCDEPCRVKRCEACRKRLKK